MTPREALLEFLGDERKPMPRPALAMWLERFNKLPRPDWPRLTLSQWDDVIGQAIADGAVVSIDDKIGLPTQEAAKQKEVQGSLF